MNARSRGRLGLQLGLLYSRNATEPGHIRPEACVAQLWPKALRAVKEKLT